jgi:hypothetical protein
MLVASILALSSVAIGPAPVTQIRPASEIIELRAAMFDTDGVRRDQVRFYTNERAETVGAIQDGQTTWNAAASERQRLGGENAPELILVRAFDAVFAIDPFERLPEGDIELWRRLTRGTSLETDRTLYDRRGIERAEELTRLLESARQEWLRANGYTGIREFRNPNAGDAPAQGATLPEPAGWFQIPEDMPRGRSKEQVQAPQTGRAPAVAAAMLAGDEPIRISLPFGTAPDVVASVERRNATEVASR